jgi:hypothetical protein
VTKSNVIAEWQTLGFRHDFHRPIEREFAIAILKHLAPSVHLANDVEVATQLTELHLDFVVRCSTRAIGVNIDDRTSPSALACPFRDLLIANSQTVSVVYSLQSSAAEYTLDDALYFLSLSEPVLFLHRSLQVLKTASRLGRQNEDIRMGHGYIEGRLHLDEWDPPSLLEYVWVRRVDPTDSAWHEELQFIERHPHYSLEKLAASWLHSRAEK